MRWVASFLLVSPIAICHCQSPQPAQAEVTFQFERPGLTVPKFVILVHEDGTGSYTGETAATSGGSDGALRPASPGQKIDRAIKLTPSTTDVIFKTARSLDYFTTTCASKAKNIADTGKKVLTYSGADGHGTCTYNYSESKSITQLTETFQAIAFTMDEGRKLDFMHRYDRLGLYTEIDTLRHEVEAKRALELGNISQSLASIAGDEALMEKVRERATALLNMAGETLK